MTTPSDDGELRQVFVAADVAVLPVVKSVLQAAEIPFIVQGEAAFSQLPVGPLRGPLSKHGLAARVLVPVDREDEARALLADVDASSLATGEELPEELTGDPDGEEE